MTEADTNAGVPDSASEGAPKKTQKKRNKVRSAWISFIGRIVAQIIGAAATIVLTLLLVQKYSDSKSRVAPQPAATVRIEFVLDLPAARAGNQADIAAAVARAVIAATQHAVVINGSVASMPGVSRASTQ
jgi:hypothetical protein